MQCKHFFTEHEWISRQVPAACGDKVQQFLNMFYKFLHRGNISTNKMCVKNFFKCQYYQLSVGFILANKLTKTLQMSIYISKLREKLVMMKKVNHSTAFLESALNINMWWKIKHEYLCMGRPALCTWSYQTQIDRIMVFTEPYP